MKVQLPVLHCRGRFPSFSLISNADTLFRSLLLHSALCSVLEVSIDCLLEPVYTIVDRSDYPLKDCVIV